MSLGRILSVGVILTVCTLNAVAQTVTGTSVDKSEAPPRGDYSWNAATVRDDRAIRVIEQSINVMDVKRLLLTSPKVQAIGTTASDSSSGKTVVWTLTPDSISLQRTGHKDNLSVLPDPREIISSEEAKQRSEKRVLRDELTAPFPALALERHINDLKLSILDLGTINVEDRECDLVEISLRMSRRQSSASRIRWYFDKTTHLPARVDLARPAKSRPDLVSWDYYIFKRFDEQSGVKYASEIQTERGLSIIVNTTNVNLGAVIQ